MCAGVTSQGGHLEPCQIKHCIAWSCSSTCGTAFLRQGASNISGLQTRLHEVGCHLLRCLRAALCRARGCHVCLGRSGCAVSRPCRALWDCIGTLLLGACLQPYRGDMCLLGCTGRVQLLTGGRTLRCWACLQRQFDLQRGITAQALIVHPFFKLDACQ